MKLRVIFLLTVLTATLVVVGEAFAQRAGTVFKDCEECPEMVVVPAGSFTMGSPASEQGRNNDENPQHPVTIARQFAAGKFSVTKAQFAAFVNETGHNAGDECAVFTGKGWPKQAGKGWRNPGYSQTDNDPVVCVNWNDAKAYVGWLARKTGRKYRLMSEAEWEYAARAGTSGRRYWGENDSDACRYANVADASAKRVYDLAHTFPCNDGFVATSPVGSYQPNGFGLYDMIGNTWQWVEDCSHNSYNGAPANGAAWTSGNCGRRVLRGGSWSNYPQFARSALRIGHYAVARLNILGFRVARTD